MGWKNVKQHYGIEHIVCVTDAGICIGSQFVHNLLTIHPDLTIGRLTSLGRGKPFDGWVDAMEADRETLKRLIETPDTFERSLPVYTYDGAGNIIEKQCEEHGWPNVTHDGDVMYDNTYSADRDKVVRFAARHFFYGAKMARRRIKQHERDLADAKAWLAQDEEALAKLGGVAACGELDEYDLSDA
jgi:hypothetical protein